MTKPITEQRLYNITLFYLERFEASSLKIKQMLERRIHKEKTKGAVVPENYPQLIQNVIQKMTHLGYINDTRFAGNQIRQLAAAGKSKSFILNKLSQAGIKKEEASALLATFEEENESSDLVRAQKWLKKHRKGFYRRENAELFYQKDLAALARAGFSFDTATQALQTQPNEDDFYF